MEVSPINFTAGCRRKMMTPTKLKSHQTIIASEKAKQTKAMLPITSYFTTDKFIPSKMNFPKFISKII